MRNVSSSPEPARERYGQSTAALPGASDVDFLGDLKRDGRVRFGFESGLKWRSAPKSRQRSIVMRGARRSAARKRSTIVGQAYGACMPYADRAIGPCTDGVEVVASCQVIWERLPCGGFAFAHLLAF
jgi:hypothetical protein